MAADIQIPWHSKNYPIEKKRGLLFEAEGLGIAALGALELSVFPFIPPVFGILAIALGGLVFLQGMKLFKSKK